METTLKKQLIVQLSKYRDELLKAEHRAAELIELETVLSSLQREVNYFSITKIHKDDLKNRGFDTNLVTPEVLEGLANKLENDYLEQLYWTSLEIIAEGYFEIPYWRNFKTTMQEVVAGSSSLWDSVELEDIQNTIEAIELTEEIELKNLVHICYRVREILGEDSLEYVKYQEAYKKLLLIIEERKELLCQ